MTEEEFSLKGETESCVYCAKELTDEEQKKYKNRCEGCYLSGLPLEED